MINQHKQMAMGKKIGFAKGGAVVVGAKSLTPGGTMGPIKGQPMNPLTKAKMNNGIPGFKGGGKVKACGCKGPCKC